MVHYVNVIFPSVLLPSSRTKCHALLEFKAGVGGAESNLFLSDLAAMYRRYAIIRGWHYRSAGLRDHGAKHAIVEVLGEGSYESLRWETGIHRVQRVPGTESGRRVHTSTASLIVSSGEPRGPNTLKQLLF